MTYLDARGKRRREFEEVPLLVHRKPHLGETGEVVDVTNAHERVENKFAGTLKKTTLFKARLKTTD